MASSYDILRINTEIKLENNARTWLQQMVITISIAVAILAFFEIKGGIQKNILAMSSLILLFTTALLIGILSSLAYYKRKNKLIKDGVLSKSLLNDWYFIVGILTIVSFVGIVISIIMLKKRS